METVLDLFFSRRQQILDELSKTGAKVSRWYEERKSTDATLKDLAALEGMLGERRILLERLLKLDDEMLDELVRRRSAAPPAELDGASPR